MLSLTVVINTFSKRNREFLHQLSNSLEKQKDNDFDLLLIADGDEKFVEELQEIFHKARIIQSKGKNLSASRNIALRNSDSEVLAYIDDDAFPDEKWVIVIKKSFEDNSVVGFGGLTKPYCEEELKFPPELNWVVGCTYRFNRDEVQIVRNPQGCNMAIRRAIALKVNGFDESLGRDFDLLLGGEEPDLFLRIYKAFPESKTVYDPSGIVFHNVSTTRLTLKYFMKRSFHEGVSKRFIKSKMKKEDPLETEFSYLSKLIFKSIPKYFLNVLKLKQIRKNLNYIFSIFISIFMVGYGYIISPIYLKRKRKKTKK